MATAQLQITSEQESRQIAEQARQTKWEGRGFLRDLFLGKFQLDLVHPFPLNGNERAEFTKFCREMKQFLTDCVDPVAIDQTGEYPALVIAGLKRLGAFGMKIPKEYGGLGFTSAEYCKAMELIGSYDANILALLSPHQSIGVPQPLKLFGTPEQKEKYLPRCAAGAISAFALTEANSAWLRLNLTGQLSRIVTGQAIYNVVSEYAQALGFGEIAPHDLRRRFAKLAHKGGSGLDQIQLSLGHGSIQTTERYLGVDQDLTDAPCDHLGLRL